jgi:sensor c-di-GMP phosphodiesterase-like protein
MIEQSMCKDVKVGCDDQNSKEYLKKINQVILVFYEDLNMMPEPIYRTFAIYLCIVTLISWNVILLSLRYARKFQVLRK